MCSIATTVDGINRDFCLLFRLFITLYIYHIAASQLVYWPNAIQVCSARH